MISFDCLGHSFSFLTLRELHHVCSVSRDWLNVVHGHMPSLTAESKWGVLGCGYSITELQANRNRSSILMQRHIASLKVTVGSCEDDLGLLSSLGESWVPFLNQIRELWLITSPISPFELQQFLNGIYVCVRLESLSLEFHVPDAVMVELDLTPLTHLRRLHTLRIGPEYPMLTNPPSAKQIEVIRNLSTITDLFLYNWTLAAEPFSQLFRSPFTLQLKEFPIHRLTKAHVNAFQTTIPLRTLTVNQHETDDVSYLRFLPGLTTLRLEWSAPQSRVSHLSPGTPPADDLVTGLLYCRQLMTLQLTHASQDFNASHLTLVLQKLSALTYLYLDSLPSLTTLEPFSQLGPHHTQLTTLFLSRLGVNSSMPSDEIQHLYSLIALEFLRLSGVLILPPDIQRGLTPKSVTIPSRLLPALTCFSYEPHSRVADD